MNEAIQEMKRRPGQYIISSRRLWNVGCHYRVEVDESGTVHQLTKEGKRDGVLADDGWRGDEVAIFVQ